MNKTYAQVKRLASGSHDFNKMKISIHKSVWFRNNNDKIMSRLRGTGLAEESEVAY